MGVGGDLSELERLVVSEARPYAVTIKVVAYPG